MSKCAVTYPVVAMMSLTQRRVSTKSYAMENVAELQVKFSDIAARVLLRLNPVSKQFGSRRHCRTERHDNREGLILLLLFLLPGPSSSSAPP